MSSYTLRGKSPFLATSLAERPFDESFKTVPVPTKMKFFPIHYFPANDLITDTMKSFWQQHFAISRHASPAWRLLFRFRAITFEIARVLMRLNHIAYFIVNADHRIM
jgi:hypothetical protein